MASWKPTHRINNVRVRVVAADPNDPSAAWYGYTEEDWEKRQPSYKGMLSGGIVFGNSLTDLKFLDQELIPNAPMPTTEGAPK